MEFREKQLVQLKGSEGLRDWFMRRDEKNLMCAGWLSGYMIIACKHLKGINTGEGEKLAQGEEPDPGLMGDIKREGGGRWVSWQSISQGCDLLWSLFQKPEGGSELVLERWTLRGTVGSPSKAAKWREESWVPTVCCVKQGHVGECWPGSAGWELGGKKEKRRWPEQWNLDISLSLFFWWFFWLDLRSTDNFVLHPVFVSCEVTTPSTFQLSRYLPCPLFLKCSYPWLVAHGIYLSLPVSLSQGAGVRLGNICGLVKRMGNEAKLPGVRLSLHTSQLDEWAHLLCGLSSVFFSAEWRYS